jgi:hypothetical protein
MSIVGIELGGADANLLAQLAGVEQFEGNLVLKVPLVVSNKHKVMVTLMEERIITMGKMNITPHEG